MAAVAIKAEAAVAVIKTTIIIVHRRRIVIQITGGRTLEVVIAMLLIIGERLEYIGIQK